MEATGRRARPVQADLAEYGVAADLIVRRPVPPALLVNSASRFDDDRLETVSREVWDGAFAANLRAPVLLAQAFAAALPAERGGLIVNIIDQRVWRLTPQLLHLHPDQVRFVDGD